MGLLSRTRERGSEATVAAHPFYAEALHRLPSATVWAVMADAEFHLGGVRGLRGVLHHDGAMLRFMTWGGVERFVASPMEFDWELVDGHLLEIRFGSQTARFMNLRPLSFVIQTPPSYAALSGDDAMTALQDWMRSWA